ncbi:uncharacterized protein B0T15DRAFT_253466 [Chaetomium strumarium]|uniref:Uncharacterized protein n=1 Tax=Chaetomium strumarium TaxID=1170767 RepID=A0AAJ0GRI2_9PEZI|nr:hypothetical protein B0T15DRAFT_253466 [Chaetomium strumarium]
MISDRALPVLSVGGTLHPDAARASRKRAKDDLGDEHEVSRQRSTSRHKEVEEFGDLRSVCLQRKNREVQIREDGKRVQKPIKQRRKMKFCHECKSLWLRTMRFGFPGPSSRQAHASTVIVFGHPCVDGPKMLFLAPSRAILSCLQPFGCFSPLKPTFGFLSRYFEWHCERQTFSLHLW